jgi:hypothetical protein
MKMTIEAPMRLPTYISGSFSRIELTPTDNSLTEVKNPNTIKETANEDTRRILDNRSTELIARPEPTQIPINDSA